MIDKKKLKQLEREADVAAVALFMAQDQLDQARELHDKACEHLKQSQANKDAAYANFGKRKHTYLAAKVNPTVAEFTLQGISVTMLPKSE